MQFGEQLQSLFRRWPVLGETSRSVKTRHSGGIDSRHTLAFSFASGFIVNFASAPQRFHLCSRQLCCLLTIAAPTSPFLLADTLWSHITSDTFPLPLPSCWHTLHLFFTPSLFWTVDSEQKNLSNYKYEFYLEPLQMLLKVNGAHVCTNLHLLYWKWLNLGWSG